MKFQGKNLKGWQIEELIFLDKDGKEKNIRPLKFGELLSNEDLIEYL